MKKTHDWSMRLLAYVGIVLMAMDYLKIRGNKFFSLLFIGYCSAVSVYGMIYRREKNKHEKIEEKYKKRRGSYDEKKKRGNRGKGKHR